ncbi:predicted protein [Plenodomus lingam JN3]|uniref:Predicted protein n=1 Tax=Leptosphaeria maculans (strain JN3 / isolate v23.1.3 / race Av1-4-5-6-7-8) TaxID=985895 RepID=E4ZLQ0_LEPMJ|nr:predicted protein [Plenodomus lingam JN3]CBX92730.1 predicted protein [Plenodomus lingam JN3]
MAYHERVTTYYFITQPFSIHLKQDTSLCQDANAMRCDCTTQGMSIIFKGQ